MPSNAFHHALILYHHRLKWTMGGVMGGHGGVYPDMCGCISPSGQGFKVISGAISKCSVFQIILKLLNSISGIDERIDITY